MGLGPAVNGQGKGAKDQTHPTGAGHADESLAEHLQHIKALREAITQAGLRAKSYLPDALDRKLPGAAQAWVWQSLFPRVAVE